MAQEWRSRIDWTINSGDIDSFSILAHSRAELSVWWSSAVKFLFGSHEAHELYLGESPFPFPGS